MKATNLRQGQGENLNSTVFDKKPCHVCGTKSYSWGYIMHGKAHVCSKDCYETYLKRRNP